MFKIGDFSRLSQVSVHTLRHYDQIGLLKPAHVDRFTDYRYYCAEQLLRLNRILALKDLGFTLEQIGRLLDDGLAVQEMRGMLKLRRAEIEQQARDEQARLARVEARLSYLEREGKMPNYEVVVKKVEPQRVASAREIVPTAGEMPGRCGALFQDVYAWAGAQGLRPSAVCMSIYYNPEYVERDIDVEVAALVTAPGGATQARKEGHVGQRLLEGVETMASTIHYGTLDNILEAYAAIGSWIQSNGYRIAGPCREIYLQDPHGPAPVTEIQFPVERA